MLVWIMKGGGGGVIISYEMKPVQIALGTRQDCKASHKLIVVNADNQHLFLVHTHKESMLGMSVLPSSSLEPRSPWSHKAVNNLILSH